MKTLLCCIAALSALSAGIAPAAADQISRCVISVSDVTYLDGPCLFDSQENGDFTLGTGEAGKGGSRHFAYVFVDGDRAEAFWNGAEAGDHAHEALGWLDRDGACWVGPDARICAYR